MEYAFFIPFSLTVTTPVALSMVMDPSTAPPARSNFARTLMCTFVRVVASSSLTLPRPPATPPEPPRPRCPAGGAEPRPSCAG